MKHKGMSSYWCT